MIILRNKNIWMKDGQLFVRNARLMGRLGEILSIMFRSYNQTATLNYVN